MKINRLRKAGILGVAAAALIVAATIIVEKLRLDGYSQEVINLCGRYSQQRESEIETVSAKILLAECYRKGIGRNRDINQAELLLREAVESGSLRAQTSLANLLLLENGDERGYLEAILLLEAARDQGESSASLTLAIAYRNGLGVSRNDQVAFGYLEESALSGNMLAAFLCYAAIISGEYGQVQNQELANTWLSEFDSLMEKSFNNRAEYLQALKEDVMIKRYFLSQESVEEAIRLMDSI